MAPLFRVLQRVVRQVHLDHVFPGRLHRLLDGDRHLTRFAIAKANPSAAIADNRLGRKPELTSAFDNLRNTIDGDQLFEKVVSTRCSFHSCHNVILVTPSRDT